MRLFSVVQVVQLDRVLVQLKKLYCTRFIDDL